MLLNHLRRLPDPMDERDRGSALAAVVALVAISGIIAAALLTGAMFSTGFTSASRAGVQALAAAEAGIDYAVTHRNMCVDGIIKSPDARPEFSVTVSRLGADGVTWVATCDTSTATEVRLLSTGRAAARGAVGHDRGNTRKMAAVLGTQLPRAIVGDRFIHNSGNMKLPVAGLPTDILTNGDFTCNGTLKFSGTLYVGGTYNSTLNCKHDASSVVQGPAVDPTAPENVFPRLRKTDPRWPTATRTLAQVKSSFGSTSANPCSVDATGTNRTVVLAYEPIVVDATGCTNGFVLDINATIVLHGDVVIFAEKLSLASNKTIQLRSGDGKPHRLYLVKPWPADRVGGCPSTTPADFAFNGILQSEVDSPAGAVLYSSTTIASGPTSSKKFPGQIYACALDLKGGTEVTFAPVGAQVLLAKHDVG